MTTRQVTPSLESKARSWSECWNCLGPSLDSVGRRVGVSLGEDDTDRPRMDGGSLRDRYRSNKTVDRILTEKS